jgi:hypothetical protein
MLIYLFAECHGSWPNLFINAFHASLRRRTLLTDASASRQYWLYNTIISRITTPARHKISAYWRVWFIGFPHMSVSASHFMVRHATRIANSRQGQFHFMRIMMNISFTLYQATAFPHALRLHIASSPLKRRLRLALSRYGCHHHRNFASRWSIL